MSTFMGFGLIPSWQFSDDPAVNPKINPFVQYPAGVYQTTPQPFYPYWQGPTNGLGNRFVERVKAAAIRTADAEAAQRQAAAYHNDGYNGVAGPRVVLRGAPLGIWPMDTWAWTNRKWIALGVVGLVGAGLLTKLFR